MIELKGDQGPNPTPITIHQLKRLQNTNKVEALFQLILEPSPSIHSPTSPIPPLSSKTALPSSSTPQLQKLITTYSTLFSPPTTLPPSRHTDHSINLLPNTAPISVRPYRYPHFQKQEIEI